MPQDQPFGARSVFANENAVMHWLPGLQVSPAWRGGRGKPAGRRERMRAALRAAIIESDGDPVKIAASQANAVPVRGALWIGRGGRHGLRAWDSAVSSKGAWVAKCLVGKHL